MSKKNLQVGGQAVIEGVMMRAQDAYAVAVRRRDGSIFVRKQPYISLIRKYKMMSWPIFRGAVVLIESVVLGVKALSFSGDIAMEDEKRKNENNHDGKYPVPQQKGLVAKVWLTITVLLSFVIGLFIFFYVPLILTDLLGTKTGFMFNLIDGILRLAIFLSYLFAITLMKDIRRIFEYHGAEHKSIFAFERNKNLIPTEAKLLSRFHPRCGTSFLLIVMIVSIIVFMFLGKPLDLSDRLFRLAFIPLIGGLSYELIRLSDTRSKKAFWTPFILPGLWLQRITTKEPDESQLEVAIVALKCALGMEVSGHRNVVFEGQPSPQAAGIKSQILS
ncbi:MAG: DUF1385 domain-containing protein [bacterium]